jgi:hypothetical protein
VIEQDAWTVIDRGVQQRVKVLEMFSTMSTTPAGSSTTASSPVRW